MITKMATYETAEDKYITINSIKFAYRRFGTRTGVPLFLHMHFRGTMDHWDPTFINPLAATRPILLLDNAGVGRSDGSIPTTFVGWAQVVLDFFAALNLSQVDVLGFSMGGCAAQMIALNAPKGLVRRLILAGTMPSTGEGTVVAADLGPFLMIRDAVSREEQKAGFLESFFAPSERSQAAGDAAFERIYAARPKRADYVAVEDAKRQGLAFVNFQHPAKADEGSYNRLEELKMPVLIANGHDDLLMPTKNSIVMYRQLENANAQLHLYPDSGHGFLYQYAAHFSKLVNDFLDDASLTPVTSHL
ncbi:alpha/beta-hydrolase [Karstenula rhodostoma CBS 690.94]|uniref:Alpha/beta-hydrolase n=1 Tax=Karstenula rhodostoma CBS 690.94 TaxID=1392251 RepID=A0A9P4PUJ9_9PLEO|nr:alpha/beta-hydrolase [Karstenula rhodostoma CBS 690.94]